MRTHYKKKNPKNSTNTKFVSINDFLQGRYQNKAKRSQQLTGKIR